ncbi:hypothetical protein T01_4167 [Trichinella spiralis]|uniref:Uncharacterized protein n=1 Tax=Trichinella spiralis TaxID=6334 RepID=A0A0V1C298_TRISP|nr:hypothetical protein T01_4167 [Trichinella spiralis]
MGKVETISDIYLMVLTENMLKMHWYTLISSFPLNHLKIKCNYYRFVNALPLIHDVVVRIRQQRFVYTLATFAPADCRHDGRKAVWRESIVNAQKHAIFYSINCFETKLQSTLRCHFKRSSPLSQYSINRTCLDWLLFKLAKPDQDMLTGTGCQRPKRHNCTNSFGRQAAGHNLAPTQQQGHFSC